MRLACVHTEHMQVVTELTARPVWLLLALFLVLPTLQFSITLLYVKTEGECLVCFITWMTSMSTLGRQRGGVPDWKNKLKALSFNVCMSSAAANEVNLLPATSSEVYLIVMSACPSGGFPNLNKIKNLLLVVLDKERMVGDRPPTLCLNT